MKKFDVLIWTLLTIGGLNWGIIGLFDYNVVATIFGEMEILSRIVYVLVGLAAVYDIVFLRLIWKRWNIHLFKPAHT